MIEFPNKKYQIIYADPPWQYTGRQYQSGNRKFEHLELKHYNTMPIQDIKNLPVKDITDKDCICFMWVTDSHLKEGIELMEAWGFKYKTIAFNWVKHYESGKECILFAPWILKSWEICLLGTKGSMLKYKKVNNIRGLLQEVRTKHSKKPNEARLRIDKMFGNIPKIELFARQKYDGWDCWGNEV